MFKRLILNFAMLTTVLGLISGATALQAAGDKEHNLIIQVVDNDPGRWKQTLSIAKNLKKDMGKENLEIEIVAHGGGLKMILQESEVANLLAEVQKEGVVLAACAATMKAQNVTDKDLVQGARVVPFGAKEIMAKQEAGWSYLRM